MIYVVGEEPGNPDSHSTSMRLAHLFGVSEREMLAHVTWVNLFASPTPDAIVDLIEGAATEHDAIVLLGRRVARGWRLGHLAPLQSIQRDNGPKLVLIPHPSGRNRWWNDPDHVEDAAIVAHQIWLRCAR